jgi:hypothetical protein
MAVLLLLCKNGAAQLLNNDIKMIYFLFFIQFQIK